MLNHMNIEYFDLMHIFEKIYALIMQMIMLVQMPVQQYLYEVLLINSVQIIIDYNSIDVDEKLTYILK
jgi:hypothetical protein